MKACIEKVREWIDRKRMIYVCASDYMVNTADKTTDIGNWWQKYPALLYRLLSDIKYSVI